jgi:hypothetical protein
VCSLGYESGEAASPHRVVSHTLLDEKHKIGSFIPFFSKPCDATKDQPIGIMLYKGGQGNPTEENKHYNPKVLVRFNESGSCDEKFMLEGFLPLWRDLEGPTPRVRMLFMDHHKAHFTQKVMDEFLACRTIVCKIPKSMTSVLQALDVYVFSSFRHLYGIKADDFVFRNPKHVPNAMEKRIYTQKFSAESMLQILHRGRFEHYFEQLGYWKPTSASVKLRGLPGYVYDPDWEPASDVVDAIKADLDKVAARYEATRPLVLPAPAAPLVQAIAKTPAKPPAARTKRGKMLQVGATLPKLSTFKGFTPVKQQGLKRPRPEGPAATQAAQTQADDGDDAGIPPPSAAATQAPPDDDAAPDYDNMGVAELRARGMLFGPPPPGFFDDE